MLTLTPLGGAECAVCLPLGGAEWQDRGAVRLGHRERALPDGSSTATGPSRTTILDAIDTPDEVAHEIFPLSVVTLREHELHLEDRLNDSDIS